MHPDTTRQHTPESFPQKYRPHTSAAHSDRHTPFRKSIFRIQIFTKSAAPLGIAVQTPPHFIVNTRKIISPFQHHNFKDRKNFSKYSVLSSHLSHPFFSSAKTTIALFPSNSNSWVSNPKKIVPFSHSSVFSKTIAKNFFFHKFFKPILSIVVYPHFVQQNDNLVFYKVLLWIDYRWISLPQSPVL